MEELLIIILQFFGELILQLFFEVIVELIFRPIFESVWHYKITHPIVASLGYTLLGAGVGALSVWLFPTLFIKPDWLRIVNLIFTPLLVGMGMAWLGHWRAARGQTVIRLDTFAYGAGFAFALAAVRFVWAN